MAMPGISPAVVREGYVLVQDPIGGYQHVNAELVRLGSEALNYQLRTLRPRTAQLPRPKHPEYGGESDEPLAATSIASLPSPLPGIKTFLLPLPSLLGQCRSSVSRIGA